MDKFPFQLVMQPQPGEGWLFLINRTVVARAEREFIGAFEVPDDDTLDHIIIAFTPDYMKKARERNVPIEPPVQALDQGSLYDAVRHYTLVVETAQ